MKFLFNGIAVFTMQFSYGLGGTESE